MPVFGKSLFETVLDGMETEGEAEDDEPVVLRPRVGSAFVADTSFRDADDGRPLGALYEAFAEPSLSEPSVPSTPAPPDWLDRLSERDVADDLGLRPGMDRADIRARRRAFARENHPDRVHEDFRAAATARMTIANRLVEAALSP
ncbi:MAG: hypothetical protein KDJ87_10285 [Rhizobiaceae bacterium]|nr:hypothetical protein [Rhizobiaceae bacterium]